MNAIVVAILAILLTTSLEAQSIAGYLARGDSLAATRNASRTLEAYELALKMDSTNVKALQKGASVLVAMVEMETDQAIQQSLASKAEAYARRAFSKDSISADAHFVMAQALGRMAELNRMTLGLKYGTVIYKHARACLAVQPNHGGCAHVLGAWNAEIMRTPFAGPALLVSLTKDSTYASASWDTAEVYLKRAIAAEPTRAIHHLVLGRVYVTREKHREARAEFVAAQRAPFRDFNDSAYKAQATEALTALKNH